MHKIFIFLPQNFYMSKKSCTFAPDLKQMDSNMNNETTVMKALIVAFIIGLVTVAYMCVGDYYKDISEEITYDTVNISVLENVDLYNFKQPMIYYGSN